jgi:hypothetical protein
MIADIAHGHVDGADVLFLIAAIIFGIAAILPHTHHRTEGARLDLGVSLIPAGLCLISIAWLIL